MSVSTEYNANYWSQFQSADESVSEVPVGMGQEQDIAAGLPVLSEEEIVSEEAKPEDEVENYFSQFEPAELDLVQKTDNELIPEGETPKTIAQKAIENIEVEFCWISIRCRYAR